MERMRAAHAPAPRRPVVTQLELSLFEGFELRRQERVVPLTQGTQRVLAFLALQNRSQLRSYVAGVLWPDTGDSLARANLRSALWRLHRQCDAAIAVSAQKLSLGREVMVDVHEATARARWLIETGPTGPEPDFDSSALGGELLPGWYEDWVIVERERLHQQRLHALEHLCLRLAFAGRHAEAVDTGLHAVAMEPLRESARAALIKAYLLEGNRNEAVRQYGLYRELVNDELRTEPSAHIRHLIEEQGRPTTIG